MHLDIESLRTLLAVLDHGSMTRAAERLHLSQSAVSRKIQRLEERVGRPLLIRYGHELRPTRDGRALITEARTMVELHDRAVAKLESSGLTGNVKLGTNGEVDLRQVASLLGTFKVRHPAASVEFTLTHQGDLPDRIDSGDIDIASFQVERDQIRPSDHVLWSEDLVWATSATCCFDVSPLPLIDFGDCCFYNTFTHTILTKGGIEFTPVFSTPASAYVRAAVEAGIGVAVMDRRYLGGSVVEWTPPVPLDPLPDTVQVLRSAPGEHSEALDALAEIIRSELTRERVVV